ncbi:hypothetical protein BGX23_000195, partial [Mortierella sp. AD031]
MRRRVYHYCVDVQDLAEAIRDFEPELDEEYKHALGQRVSLLMGQLELEEDACNATEESARANAEYVRRNQWLIYNYAQKFGEFTGEVDYPASSDPVQL